MSVQVVVQVLHVSMWASSRFFQKNMPVDGVTKLLLPLGVNECENVFI